MFKNFKKNLNLVNDLRDIDGDGVLKKITANTVFSFSYVVLLSAATVVCTLGLLLNSTPIVIGGMLISPLMWPLMKISIGLSFERKALLIQAFYLLFFSILISFLCAVLITTVVPFKSVTNEILSRTTPTFLDICVAIAAGSIAAFSVIQKKISDSLAGVAIATSLMPPLCVSGIGLVLADYQVAFGGFFLFFTNIVSIIFISVFIFSFVGIKRDGTHDLRRKGIIYIILVLLLTSIPLFNSLQNYSFKLRAYQESKEVITDELFAISPALTIQNISTSSDESVKDTILVNADIISPETINLDYSQKEKIVERLEETLDKKIVLNLRVQKTISLRSEEDIINGNSKRKIAEYVEGKVATYSDDLNLANVESELKNGKWQVVVVLRTEPSGSFREAERQLMQDELSVMLNTPVSLTINLVPLLSLTGDQVALTDEIRKDVESFFELNSPQFELQQLQISETDVIDVPGFQDGGKVFSVKISGTLPADTELENIELLQAFLADSYDAQFVIDLSVTEVTKIILD